MDIFLAKSWKIGQNQFFGREVFFSQKKWGPNKIEYVCILGCVEKLRNTKSNYGYSYFIAPWYIETEKT